MMTAALKQGRLVALLMLGALAMVSPHAWAGGGLPAHASGQAQAHVFIPVVHESEQFNLDDLQIGLGYVGSGPYIDGTGERRNGLHASLSIVVDDKPSLFQQPDVHKGEVISVGNYRITIVDISTNGRGSVAFEVKTKKRRSSHMGGRAQ